MTRTTISGDERVKLTIWMHENKDVLHGKTIAEIETIVGRQFTDVRFAKSAIVANCNSLGIARIRRYNKQETVARIQTNAHRKIRVMAAIIRQLYERLGEPVPDVLIELAKGTATERIERLESNGQ